MIANPSPHQLAIFDALLNTNQNIVVKAGPGCLHPNTPILMFNGKIKYAKEIKIGDKVMGPDSKVRNVINTDTGIDQLYKIIPQKGENWICNDQHILTVYDRDRYMQIKTYKNSKHTTPLKDISIQCLLKENTMTVKEGVKNNYIRKYYLQRVGINFKTQSTFLDPYLMGLWLGDGSITGPCISTKDLEIIDFCRSIKVENIKCKIRLDKTCYTISLTGKNHSKKKNLIYEEFKKAIFDNEKGIPFNYLINNKKSRLKLLAGLIDTDGYMNNGFLEIIQKSNKLTKDIVFLCRSLGMAAYSKKVLRGCQTGVVGEYNWISISGDFSEVPCLLKRKRYGKRKQIKSVLRTGFKIEPYKKGKWCGFQVDGDNRFVLGDFTITHNSGKTSTIVTAAKLLPASVSSCFLSFNRSIVETLRERLPSNVVCATAHSFGMQALIRHYHIQFRVNPLKGLFFIIDQLKRRETRLQPKQVMALQFQLVEVIDRVRISALPHTVTAINSVCDHHLIVLEDQDVTDCLEVLRVLDFYNQSFSKSRNQLDFTDMVTLSLNPKVRLPQFDCVFVDETQDLSKAQQHLVDRLVNHRGRVVAIGDDKQSIYQFASASGDSFEHFQGKPNTITLPLSVSYRCSKAVVRNAQAIYPEIDVYDQSQEGEVRDGSIDEISVNDMVICRNTRPLIEVYLKLLERGVPATVIGKDFEVGLSKLISKVANCDVEVGMAKLRELRLKLKAELVAQKRSVLHNKRFVHLSEQVQIIEVLSASCEHMSQVERKVEQAFKESDGNVVRLMTVHRAKGLEADRVFLITHFDGKQLMPSSYAVQEWEKVAERNVAFVAATRAKRSLINVRL